MSVVAIDISPASGSLIARQDALAFTLHDLGSVVVAVVYPGGRREVVFSGSAFAPVFAFRSTTQDLGDGLGTRFTVYRTGGWDEAPTLDASEAAETIPGWGYPFAGG